MAVSEKEKRKKLLSLLPEKNQEPACPHVKEGCGGCMLQEWSYDSQIEAKKKLLHEIYGAEIPIVKCPDALGYRNRMDFVCTQGKIGLRQRGRFNQIVDIKDCFLIPENAREVYKKSKEIIERADWEYYDLVKHTGFIRYLVIRTSRTRKETMLVITTVSPKNEEEHTRFQAIFKSLLDETGVKSVHWRVNDGKGDVSVGEPYRFYGQEFIMDDIADKQFMIYPETFFQANTLMVEDMFLKVKSFAKGRVLDLYCGVGCIALLVHDSEAVSDVTGVEVVEQSIVAAKENARMNRTPEEKCQFFTSDVSAYLGDKIGERFDTVICDPARPGLGEKVCASLVEMCPEQIIYISCNPLSHKEDLARLSEDYEVTLLEAHDLFPQTPHIEILSVLRRN